MNSSATEYADLLRRIKNEFEVVCREFNFGGMKIGLWELADPNSVMDDDVIAASHDELPWQPYWAQLWPAAIGLCEHLTDVDFAGQTVLDLGCGLGGPGAVAAARGGSVVLADNAPPALELARLNSWPWRDRVETRLLDWKNDRLDRQFDWILGSDIVYDPADIEYLDQFLKAHLATDGTVLLSEPSRAMTGELMKGFREFGWDWKTFERHMDEEGTGNDHKGTGNDQKIRIFQMIAGHLD